MQGFWWCSLCIFCCSCESTSNLYGDFFPNMKHFYGDYRKNYEERILKVQTAKGCIESALCRTIFQSIDKSLAMFSIWNSMMMINYRKNDADDDENGKVRARLHRLCRGETNQRALSAMASLSHEAPWRKDEGGAMMMIVTIMKTNMKQSCPTATTFA